jgi:hypothetical protein
MRCDSAAASGRPRSANRKNPSYPASRALAEYISGVNGSSLIWCSCGEILLPVVYSDGDQAEILALGCSQGHGSIRIVAGVLVGGEPANAPVH